MFKCVYVQPHDAIFKWIQNVMVSAIEIDRRQFIQILNQTSREACIGMFVRLNPKPRNPSDRIACIDSSGQLHKNVLSFTDTNRIRVTQSIFRVRLRMNASPHDTCGCPLAQGFR